MIHNLTPVPTQLYFVYEIDFVPKGLARGARDSAGAADLDGRARTASPTRSSTCGWARARRAATPIRTTPATRIAAARRRTSGSWTGRACWSHGRAPAPGRALHGPEAAPRAGRRAPLFRSKAKYFEPAGAVSWDVAMTGDAARLAREGPEGRRPVHERDLRHAGAAPGGSRWGSWSPTWPNGGPGDNPFKTRVNRPGPRDARPPARERQPRRRRRRACRTRGCCPTGPRTRASSTSSNFRYQLGRPEPRRAGRDPPVIRPGQTLTFRDAATTRSAIFHSITSCKAPCNRATGIAYPLADGEVQFESGTLGTAAPPATGALQWTTPVEPRARHLHVLLPDPPVHARCLPGQAVIRCTLLRVSAGREAVGRGGGRRPGPGRPGGRRAERGRRCAPRPPRRSTRS